TLPHPHHPIHLATLLDQEPLGRDIAMDHAGSLELHALGGLDAAPDLAADDRFAGEDVPLDHAALGDEDLPAGVNGADDGALDLHDAVRRDIADDAHPGPDDGQCRVAFVAAASFFGEDCHVSSPPSPA